MEIKREKIRGEKTGPGPVPFLEAPVKFYEMRQTLDRGAECGFSVDCVKGFCKLLTAASPSGGGVVAAML